VEAGVLQKSRSSQQLTAEARAPHRSLSKEVDRDSLGIGAYAIAGASTTNTNTGEELVVGDLNRLESDALEKLRGNLSFRQNSTRSLVASAAAGSSDQDQAASTKMVSDSAFNHVATHNHDGRHLNTGSPRDDADDVETARAGGTSRSTEDSNDDDRTVPTGHGNGCTLNWTSAGQPSWASRSQESNISDPALTSRIPEPSLPSRERSIAIASRVVEDPVIIVAARVKTVNLHRKYYKWIFLAAGALSAALVVGLSVGLTQRGSNNSPPVDVCLDRPDVFTQCGCNSSIYYLPGSRVQTCATSGVALFVPVLAWSMKCNWRVETFEAKYRVNLLLFRTC
jgi:hypothetical protein